MRLTASLVSGCWLLAQHVFLALAAPPVLLLRLEFGAMALAGFPSCLFA